MSNICQEGVEARLKGLVNWMYVTGRIGVDLSNGSSGGSRSLRMRKASVIVESHHVTVERTCCLIGRPKYIDRLKKSQCPFSF